MSTSVFTDKNRKPDEKILLKALKQTGQLWSGLRSILEEEYGPLIEEWKFYSAKSGWQLKLLRKKRNLFFFTPLDGYFMIVFVFGDRAVAAIEESDLPAEIIEELVNARKYAEGRGLRVDVRTRKDIEHVKQLVAIKVEN